MAKKSVDTNESESAPDPGVPVEPTQPAYPAVLQRVRFIGGKDAPALTAFNRKPLPPIEADDTFELERARAKSLVRYWPDRYQIVRGE